VIQGALDLAATEAETVDYGRALAELDRIKQPILQRFGPGSLTWAQWLTHHAQAIRGTRGAHNDIVQQTSAAVAIFSASRLDAGDTTRVSDYVISLEQLESEQDAAEQFDAALATLRLMDQVIARCVPNDPLERLIYAYRNATVLEHQGHLDAADDAYAVLALQAKRAMGQDAQLFQFALMHRALLATLRGDPANARSVFDQAGSFMKQGRGQRIYGAFLVTIGRGAEAVAPLQAALAATRHNPLDEDAERQIEAVLGQALAQAGRVPEARGMLRAARDAYAQWGIPGTAETLGAGERWAEFLRAQGETGPAVAEFRNVLAQSKGAPSAPAALAASGLAAASLAVGDTAQADTRSADALRLLNATTLEYDVRARIDVWLVRAEVLHALGHNAEARDLARRAVSAAEAQDAPGTAQPARAQAVLALLTVSP
jgi:Tfp pilus assembly protein PilF